jgi:hypothetical protein
MTRNLDLVRAILLAVEQHEDRRREIVLEPAGFSPNQVAYHIKLLWEAGFVEAANFGTFGGALDWRVQSLTWKGHEFLDATRQATVWKKVKAKVKKHGSAMPFTLIQELATKFLAAQVGLSR